MHDLWHKTIWINLTNVMWSRGSQIKKNTVWFHLYKVQKEAKVFSVVTSQDKSVSSKWKEVRWGRCISVLLHVNQKHFMITLTGLAQLVGHHPTKRKVVGAMPVRPQAWVAGSGPGQGADESQLIDVSLSHQCFSPYLFSSLLFSIKINK